MPRYLLIVDFRSGPDPAPMEEWDDADVQAHLDHYARLNDELRASGELVGGIALEGPDVARVVRSDGRSGTTVTEGPFADKMAAPDGGFDVMHPGNVSPVVAWLASEDAADVTGRVIEVEGGRICVEEGWRHGPATDLGKRWDAGAVGAEVRSLLGQAQTPEPVYGA